VAIGLVGEKRSALRGEAVQELELAIAGEPYTARCRPTGLFEQPAVTPPKPRPNWWGRGEQQAAVPISAHQVKRSQPDLEHRLTDGTPQLAADALPVTKVDLGRFAQLLADPVELHDDGALSFAAAVGDVTLDDRDQAGAAPPVRGAGGESS